MRSPPMLAEHAIDVMLLATDLAVAIADAGFALAAWFVDPSGNSIGLLQLKDGVGG